MWSLEDILRNDNFEHLSKGDLLEIVSILRTDLKYYRYRKDNSSEQQNTTINTLKSQLITEKAEVERLKQVNKNFRDKIIRPLTLRERIIGRLEVKN